MTHDRESGPRDRERGPRDCESGPRARGDSRDPGAHKEHAAEKKGEFIVSHRLGLKTFSATNFLFFQQRQSCWKDSILFECIFQWNLQSTMAGEEMTQAPRVIRLENLPWMSQ